MCGCLLWSAASMAQSDTTTTKDSIVVHKDERLDILSLKQAAINKRTAMMTANGMYKGFRIQVVSTNNRDEAMTLKTDLLNKYPQEKCYFIYQSPYFKVRIGNFIKREDAEKFRTELNKLLKRPVFVVEDAIEYTPPADEDLLIQ